MRVLVGGYVVDGLLLVGGRISEVSKARIGDVSYEC